MDDDARYEAELGIPLCGRAALLRFEALLPSGDSAGGLLEDGDFVVAHAAKPSVWNRSKIVATIAGVSLEGNLPADRVVGVRHGRVFTGRVTDCNGYPVAWARVWLERESGGVRWARVRPGKTNADGVYSLRAARPGNYRVAAGAARSAPDRVR